MRVERSVVLHVILVAPVDFDPLKRVAEREDAEAELFDARGYRRVFEIRTVAEAPRPDATRLLGELHSSQRVRRIVPRAVFERARPELLKRLGER